MDAFNSFLTSPIFISILLVMGLIFILIFAYILIFSFKPSETFAFPSSIDQDQETNTRDVKPDKKEISTSEYAKPKTVEAFFLKEEHKPGISKAKLILEDKVSTSSFLHKPTDLKEDVINHLLNRLIDLQNKPKGIPFFIEPIIHSYRFESDRHLYIYSRDDKYISVQLVKRDDDTHHLGSYLIKASNTKSTIAVPPTTAFVRYSSAETL